ncbi:hypothetical protein MHHB_P1175 [Methanofervidicoccus abyssi]|uniref:Uncharacterized protein n=1 Tax=Methanofervidicoccus abyssi TaxID=2082189 RepID=A0A401HRV0_9EURY|nr:hypothetical protein MHHB_P1175 [Methanofervidicoccus abyssi]
MTTVSLYSSSPWKEYLKNFNLIIIIKLIIREKIMEKNLKIKTSIYHVTPVTMV